MTENKRKRGYFNLILIPAVFVIVWLGMKWYRQPGVAAGNEAHDFKAALITGDSMQLSDLKGNWILLDFWGSWCGPCRESNRELVQLYDTYHGATFKNAKGFEVVSVGIETDRSRWQAAIQKDRLHWPYHVSDLNRFNDHVAELYGIREIPATVLINPQGNILGVNLDFTQLNGMLAKNLAK